jgi:3D (Asp-Asp-Asp) domain-containing protein
MSVTLAVIATAYCLSGTTASGQPVHHGAIAVDPTIIKMGSKIHVPGYGRGRAIDTGSAVKGYHIDLWMKSCDAARRWGARRIHIRVFT